MKPRNALVSDFILKDKVIKNLAIKTNSNFHSCILFGSEYFPVSDNRSLPPVFENLELSSLIILIILIIFIILFMEI